jgi:RimJ/RimL family protein N-acetyltransferase
MVCTPAVTHHDLRMGPVQVTERLTLRQFTAADASRIVATTMAVNHASRRVLEKAGLRYTRTVYLDWPDPLPGNERGDVEYQLDRGDWVPG